MRDIETIEEALFDNGVYPLVIADFHKKQILKINTVFVEWFRIKTPDFEVLYFDKEIDNILKALRKENIIRELFITVTHKNGNRIRCMATAHLVKEGRKEKVLIIFHESIVKNEETARLKSRSANLYTLSENIDDAFWSVDTRLTVIDFNTKFIKLLENTNNRKIEKGENFLEEIPEFMGATWEERFQRALTGEKREYTDIYLGGTMMTLVSPIYTEYGEVAGVCSTVRDITAEINRQRNVEVLHQRFNSILNSAADAAIIATDPQGIVRQFNKGASAMLGYGNEEIVGKTDLLSFYAPSFLREVKNYIKAETGKRLKLGEIFSWLSRNPDLIKDMEWSFLNKQGKPIDVKISISPVLMDDKSYAGVLIIAQDITELKKVKEELETAKMQAEEISRTKTSFLANMSHEIRTPLNGIIGMTDLLSRTGLTEVQQNHTSIILKSANTLLLLINDILDYTRIEAGKFKLGLTSFSIRTLLEDIRDMLIVNIRERNIKFNIFVDNPVIDRLVGDPRRIKQILLNLVGNAMKFTMEGSISVEIYQINEDRDHITLYFKVIDTGIGISDEEKAKLFQSFSQVDTSTTRRFGGSGLGLAISRELVSMMNGEIGMESTPGEGSTFWFTINLARDTVELENKKMLVVNNSLISRRTLTARLKSLKINVEEAATFSEAFHLCADNVETGQPFQIIFVHDNLIGEKWSTLPGTKPILLLTSYAGRGREKGFDSVLRLPVNQGDLTRCILEALQSRKTGMEMNASEGAISADEADGNRNIRILVAEDNKINQLVAMNFLKKLGYTADLVENGQQAVEAFNERYYDAIIMDQMMPVMDGIEATAQIRKGGSKKSNNNVKIIALTANAMKGDRETLIEAGMDDYISKPVLLKDIKIVLERNLNE